MAASKKGKQPVAPKTEFTPAGRAKANKYVSLPAPVAAAVAKPQQSNAKLETNTTAVDEPLITLDIPVLVPQSLTSARTSNSSEVSFANSSIGSGQPTPIHRFTCKSAEPSSERLALEETNSRMAREAQEAARERRARLMSVGGVPARDEPSEGRRRPKDPPKDPKANGSR